MEQDGNRAQSASLGSALTPIQGFLITAAATVVLLYGIHAAASILNPFLIAVVLAYTVAPLPNWLIRKVGVTPWVAVLLTLLVVIVAQTALIVLVGVWVTQFKERLPVYQGQFAAIYHQALIWLKQYQFDPSSTSLLDAVTPEKMLGISSRLLDGATSFLSTAVVVLVLLVLLVLEMVEGKDQGARRFAEAFRYYGRDVQRYMVITAGTGAINALANLVLLMFLGVDFPFLWCLLCFFLNFIPSVGFLIALVPPALLALLLFGWQRALVVAVGFVVTNTIADNVIKPHFMKKGMDVSFLTVIVSLVFWTFLLGSTGAILAIPLTMATKRFIRLRIEGRPWLIPAQPGSGG